MQLVRVRMLLRDWPYASGDIQVRYRTFLLCFSCYIPTYKRA